MEQYLDERRKTDQEKDQSNGVAKFEIKKGMEGGEHKKEWILAMIMIFLAYFYLSVIRYPTELARVIWWEAQLNTEYVRVGLAWMIFTLLFLGTGLWYVTAWDSKSHDLRSRKHKWIDTMRRRPGDSWFYLGLTLAAGIWFPFYMKGDQDILLLMILFLHGAAVYWLLSVTGNTRGKELDERGIGDLLRGFFVLPFSGYSQFWVTGGQLMRSLWHSKSEKQSRAWQVILGLLISVPVLCVAVPILRGADAYFDLVAGNLSQKLFHALEQWNVLSVMFTMVWTLALAGYFFGLFYRGIHKRYPVSSMGSASEISVEGQMGTRRQAPQVVLAGFLVPILSLYLLFFGVRLMGVTGAMDQIASGDLWISTYAREGFFELCWIAAINYVIFTVARWYSPQAGKGMRVLIGGLGVETMAFVALAFSKMWYYIRAYESFTFRRAMCCWLLLTLLVTFGLMTWELWNKKVKGVKWGVWFGSVTFLLMAYSNMPVWAP